jgi:hypothetical protein
MKSFFSQFFNGKVVVVWSGSFKRSGLILGVNRTHIFVDDVSDGVVGVPLDLAVVRLPSEVELKDYNFKIKQKEAIDDG